MGIDHPADRNGHKTEGMFKDFRKTGKTVYQILENYTENIEGGEERMYSFHKN
jgi:hypothetical protein